MQATARAQSNFALIKYWGKRDVERNLPAVGSLSITLDELATEMDVRFDERLSADHLSLNGADAPHLLPRVSACLDNLLGADRPSAIVDSRSNFPVAAGLASSASAFAALTTAAAAAAGLHLSRERLAIVAGRASGSAARSLYGGFVELDASDDRVRLQTLAKPEDWPLVVVIALTAAGEKPVSSTVAMERSRKTSVFYGRWVEEQPADLVAARRAVELRDFEQLAAVAEHNCLKMHSVMWASRPPVVYWNPATINCLRRIRELRGEGVDVFFTIDAGPQVKAVCLPDDVDQVSAALSTVDGVLGTLKSGLGPGARCVTTTDGESACRS